MKKCILLLLTAILLTFISCQQDDKDFLDTEATGQSQGERIVGVNPSSIPNVINHIAFQQVNFIPHL